MSNTYDYEFGVMYRNYQTSNKFYTNNSLQLLGMTNYRQMIRNKFYEQNEPVEIIMDKMKLNNVERSNYILEYNKNKNTWFDEYFKQKQNYNKYVNEKKKEFISKMKPYVHKVAKVSVKPVVDSYAYSYYPDASLELESDSYIYVLFYIIIVMYYLNH